MALGPPECNFKNQAPDTQTRRGARRLYGSVLARAWNDPLCLRLGVQRNSRLFFLQSGVLGGVLLFFFLLKMFGKTHGETSPASIKPRASPFSTPGLPSVHFLKHVSVCFAGGFADKNSGAWLNQSFIDACVNACKGTCPKLTTASCLSGTPPQPRRLF